MKKSAYRCISNFGSNEYSPVDNPLTYCMNDNIDQRFLHGGNSDIYGQNSKPCQQFLSEYCSQHWDGFCEYASKNTDKSWPNNLKSCNVNLPYVEDLTAGDALIRNTAAAKYLVQMLNCEKKFEPFDPTVANSPMISYFDGTNCTPVYAVDPKTVDQDVVMDKILSNPIIALDILINIYNTMKREKTLKTLAPTKLGKFYQSRGLKI